MLPEETGLRRENQAQIRPSCHSAHCLGSRPRNLAGGGEIPNARLSLLLMQINGEQQGQLFKKKRQQGTSNSLNNSLSKTMAVDDLALPTRQALSLELWTVLRSRYFYLFFLWTWKLKPREAGRPAQSWSKWQNRSGRLGWLQFYATQPTPSALASVSTASAPNCTNGQ